LSKFENWFLLPNFQISRFLKNFFYVLYGFQIQTSHGRMLSEINQNGGINQDGGVFVVIFKKNQQIDKKNSIF
jgi:hypothetical protein